MLSVLHRIAFALVLLIGTALVAPVNFALAQNFPERPIRLIVAFSAGGATDVLSRQIANDLKDALGQPVVVENRPGANGLIGWTHVATSEPDGYTLLMAENALAISQGLYKHINFDPVRQLDPVCLVGNAPLVLVTSTKLKANTLPEFIALAKATPATSELQLRRHRQRRPSGVRGVHGRRRHRRRARALQGRRPGDRRRRGRPHRRRHVGDPGGARPDRAGPGQGPGRHLLGALAGASGAADAARGRRHHSRCRPRFLVGTVRPGRNARGREGQARVPRSPRRSPRRNCASASPRSTSSRPTRRRRCCRRSSPSEIANWTKFIDAHGIKAE